MIPARLAPRTCLSPGLLLNFVAYLLCGVLIGIPRSVHAVEQLGARKGNDSYWAIDVLVRMDDPVYIQSGQFVAAPVALTTFSPSGSGSSYFIEVGPIRDCRAGSDCKLRPYLATSKAGSYQFRLDTTRLLGSSLTYGYRVAKIQSTSDTEFQAIFCGGGCGVVSTIDASRSDFPFVLTAGESSTLVRWITPIEVDNAKLRVKNVSTYVNWCYTQRSNSPNLANGIVTPCSQSTYRWEFIAAFRSFVPLYRRT